MASCMYLMREILLTLSAARYDLLNLPLIEISVEVVYGVACDVYDDGSL